MTKVPFDLLDLRTPPPHFNATADRRVEVHLTGENVGSIRCERHECAKWLRIATRKCQDRLRLSDVDDHYCCRPHPEIRSVSNRRRGDIAGERELPSRYRDHVASGLLELDPKVRW